MKPMFAIFPVILAMNAFAQPDFKMVVPQGDIVVGESFQVQYILQDAKKAGLVITPDFKGFRYVSGPNIYYGNVQGSRPMQNFVYTLEAVKPGIYILPGATIPVNGNLLRSNNAKLEVISKEEAITRYNRGYPSKSSEYFLKPGEDPYKKIRENLFVRVMVDRNKCQVGEPILATFRLYSRLESKSDIVKNPGLYGFSVHDMVNLSDREVLAEKVNGKDFDVHTIRKVQLYPLQAGDFIIDPMEVKNRVEFSVSAVNKQTEQEIVEGILGDDEHDSHPPGTEVFESSSHTDAIKIHVDALPEKNKPDSFSGAVGSFRVNTRVGKQTLLLNEEGFLELIISGKGNFVQIDAPPVPWPAGLEAFQPRLKDQLDKMNIPLRGSRSFIYPFIAVSPGSYKIPPVKFSFFDTDSNRYRVVQTEPVEILISSKKISPPAVVQKQTGHKTNFLIPAVILFVLGSAAGLLYRRKTRKAKQELSLPPAEDDSGPLPDIKTDEPGFYSAVYHALWKTISVKYGLRGSTMNKELLALLMNAKNVPPQVTADLIELIRQCEIGMFTSTVPEQERPVILEKAGQLIRELRRL